VHVAARRALGGHRSTTRPASSAPASSPDALAIIGACGRASNPFRAETTASNSSPLCTAFFRAPATTNRPRSFRGDQHPCHRADTASPHCSFPRKPVAEISQLFRAGPRAEPGRLPASCRRRAELCGPVAVPSRGRISPFRARCGRCRGVTHICTRSMTISPRARALPPISHPSCISACRPSESPFQPS
jgi:hypothetical protein